MTTHILESKAFLFDLDGTLIDTTPMVVKYWTDMANQHNLNPAQILETSHGRRTIETLERWFPKLANMDYVNALEARMSKETKGISVLPGVIDLINSIPSEDWTVNTAGTMTMATARLTQFNIKVPNEMMTGCRVNFGKPHPEGYLMAAKIVNKDPKDCLVFEDAPAGVEAAVAAGMKCIACTTTHSVEQLKQSGATVIVDRLDSVRIERQDDGTYKTVVEKAYQV